MFKPIAVPSPVPPSAKSPSAMPIPESTSDLAPPAYASLKAALLFGCYRKGDANDPEIYVKAVTGFWDRRARSVVGIDAVRYCHWAEMPPDDEGKPSDPRDVLLKGIYGEIVDRVDRISFMPGAPEIFDEDGVPVLNIWVPPKIVARAGDASSYIDHVSYILADAIAYVLDVLAHLNSAP